MTGYSRILEQRQRNDSYIGSNDLMNKLIINSSLHIIINTYKNAFIVSEYYIDIYLIQNEVKLNNPNLISKVAYL